MLKMVTGDFHEADFNEGLDEDEGIGMDRYLFRSPKNKLKEDLRGPWRLNEFKLEEFKAIDIQFNTHGNFE